MNTEKITRQESLAMRGIAITAIVLHNYCHFLPMVQENEYTFSEMNVRRLMMEISHLYTDAFAQLCSFFGHYGVPIFLILSAYGLVMKYESKNEDGTFKTPCGVWDFIGSHYKKLFFMMVTGYVFYVMVDYMTPHPCHYQFLDVVGQLGMFNNLFADPDAAICPGPYWYFGLMVQIYIVYRLVLYPGQGSLMGKLDEKTSTYILVAVAAITIFIQLVFNPEGLVLQWYRYNVFGSLGIFIAGLIFARSYKMKELSPVSNALICLVSVILIALFSMYKITWIIVPFLVCIAGLTIVKCLPQFIMKPLAWIGSISAFMFVCHPIARKILLPVSEFFSLYAGMVLYFVATIIIAILFKPIIALVTKEFEKIGKEK